LAAKREYTLNFSSIFPGAAEFPSAILSMVPFDHRSMRLAFKWEPDINVVGWRPAIPTSCCLRWATSRERAEWHK
jgi:hypothetical protein